MSDGPLVYYAARCSGGTAIHAILRDLLVLHGVRLFAAPGAPQPWIPGSVAFDLGSPGPNLKGTVTRKATLRVTGLLISTKCLPN